MGTRGVVYVAFGDRFVAEAVHSVRSLQAQCPGLPAILFTDRPLPGAPFEEVRVVEVGHIRAKVDLLAQSPFDESLYLDSDNPLILCDLGMCHLELRNFSKARALFQRALDLEPTNPRARECVAVIEHLEHTYATKEVNVKG